MLSDFDIQAYLDRQESLSDKGRDFILKTYQSPSRMVGEHARKNVVSFPFSEKAGLTLSTESRGPEGGLFALSEYEDEVMLHLDQVEPITVMKTDKNGKIRPSTYTGDALIFREEYPEVVEAKTTEEID